MNLTISGHHLEVTPALREYVLTKLDRVTRHFDQVVDINVLLTVEKQKEKERRQRAEVGAGHRAGDHQSHRPARALRLLRPQPDRRCQGAEAPHRPGAGEEGGRQRRLTVGGGRLERAVDLLDRSVAAGHELAHHGWTHRSPAVLTRELHHVA